MGSCYSVHLLLDNKNNQTGNNQKKIHCLICCEEISHQTGVYVKCSKCKILLHDICAKTYKSKTNIISNIIYCPHCKYQNSLFCYDSGICECKQL